MGGCVIGKARGKTGRMQRRLLTNQGICSICLGSRQLLQGSIQGRLAGLGLLDGMGRRIRFCLDGPGRLLQLIGALCQLRRRAGRSTCLRKALTGLCQPGAQGGGLLGLGGKRISCLLGGPLRPVDLLPLRDRTIERRRGRMRRRSADGAGLSRLQLPGQQPRLASPEGMIQRLIRACRLLGQGLQPRGLPLCLDKLTGSFLCAAALGQQLAQGCRLGLGLLPFGKPRLRLCLPCQGLFQRGLAGDALGLGGR